VIRFDKINLSYNNKDLLKDFCLEIKTGEKCLIHGKSGSGKSSLFNMILGFVRPDNGRIFFDDMVINAKNIWNVRRQVAFVDQDVSLGKANTADWLKFVFGLHANRMTADYKKKLMELFDYFELDIDAMEKDISNLSGGERQRLALIVSVLLGRSHFLLDEVTSALDDHLKQKCVDYFSIEPKWTLIAISHDSVWRKSPLFRIFDMETGQWER